MISRSVSSKIMLGLYGKIGNYWRHLRISAAIVKVELKRKKKEKNQVYLDRLPNFHMRNTWWDIILSLTACGGWGFFSSYRNVEQQCNLIQKVIYSPADN